MGKQFVHQRVVFSHFKRFLSTRGCRVTPVARNYSYCIGNGTSEFFSGGGGAEQASFEGVQFFATWSFIIVNDSVTRR